MLRAHMAEGAGKRVGTSWSQLLELTKMEAHHEFDTAE